MVFVWEHRTGHIIFFFFSFLCRNLIFGVLLNPQLLNTDLLKDQEEKL